MTFEGSLGGEGPVAAGAEGVETMYLGGHDAGGGYVGNRNGV